MQVDERVESPLRVLADPLRQRLRLGIDELRVVPVVVVRRAVFALIAVFYAIFIDERYNENFRVCQKPVSRLGTGKNLCNHSFHSPAGGHFTAVMAAGENEREFGVWIPFADTQQLDVAPLAAFTQRRKIHSRAVFDFLFEFLPVFLSVKRSQRKENRLLVRAELVRELPAAVVGFFGGIEPGFSPVSTDGWTAGTDPV